EELVLRHDVPLVEAGHLDLEPPLPERLPEELLVRRRDEGLRAAVVHLHPDRHRGLRPAVQSLSTSLYLFLPGVYTSPSWLHRFSHWSTLTCGIPRSPARRTIASSWRGVMGTEAPAGSPAFRISRYLALIVSMDSGVITGENRFA